MLASMKQAIAALVSLVLGTATAAVVVCTFLFFGTFVTVGGFLLMIVTLIAALAYGFYEWLTGKQPG